MGPSGTSSSRLGHEVSCRVFAPFLDAIRAKGGDADTLCGDVGCTSERIEDRKARVDYAVLRAFMRNVERVFGEDEIVLAGRALLVGNHRRYPRVARAVMMPADLYDIIVGSNEQPRARRLISCLDRHGWEVSDRYLVETTLEDGYEPCPGLHLVVRGMLEAIPTLLGLPAARVDFEVSSRGCLYQVGLEPGSSVLTHIRRARRRARSLRVAVYELQAAHDLLNRRNADLQRAHEDLRVSEARFRALIENSSDFVLLADEKDEVVYLSPSAERITGLAPDSLIGKSHGTLAHEDDRETLLRAISLAKQSEQVTAVRYRFRTRSGGFIWVEGTAKSMLRDARVRAVVINYRDVTDRVRLEEQLLQSRKLESIGRLAGGIAHDFNNLLTGVLGNAQLVLMRPEPYETVRERVEQIEEYARRAADLTSQLLAFARKRVVKPRQTDLNDLVLETRSLLDRLIGDRVEIVTELSPSLGRVEIDPTQFQQVIINLAVNARDAMPAGGKLTIATSRVIGARGELSAMLSVSDTGEGMDAETLANLFEPFFTTKELGRGTGLGLATSHGIVSQAGGRIEVSSALRQGSRFCVFLPLVKHAIPDEPLQTGVVRSPRGTETVLLVDDEAAVRTSTTALLQNLGYLVLTAEDGDSALALVRERFAPLHALITDVEMPRMTGPELADELRALHPRIACLFISGYGEDGHRALLPDGTPLIHKPFDILVLAHALRALIDDGRRRSVVAS